MARTLDEIQALLSTSRLHDRPKYYSSISKSYVHISYDFETFLILMENSEKNELITRLRKAAKDSGKVADRDLLAKQAAEFENAAVSAVAHDLSLDVGDYSSISTSYTAASSLPEMVQVVSSIGAALGSKLAMLDQATNESVATSMFLSNLDGNTAKEKKTQLQSWIDVITSYVTGS